MIRLVLIITGIFIYSSGLIAHEEPSKTIREKDKKERDRKDIRDNKIISYTVWKHKVKDKTPDLNDKEMFLKVVYDTEGNIAEMNVYKKNDSLDYKIVFGYDGNNNMISDTDYNPDGTIAEKIEYKYDAYGRVVEQYNYEGNNKFDSKFTYETSSNSNSLVLNKFKPIDSIEYQIVYRYDNSIDKGNNVEIVKQKKNGILIMRVENEFDVNDLRLKKKIFDENNKLMFYFGYTYFGDTEKFSEITKYSPEGQIISKTIYELNKAGFTSSVKTIDVSGNLISFSSYDYETGK